MFTFRKKAFGNADLRGVALCKRKILSEIHVSSHVFMEPLFRENHRNAEILRGGKCDRDTRGFHRNDFVNLFIAEQTVKLFSHLSHDNGVDLMVQKVVDLQDAARKDDTVGKDLFFKQLHGDHRSLAGFAPDRAATGMTAVTAGSVRQAKYNEKNRQNQVFSTTNAKNLCFLQFSKVPPTISQEKTQERRGADPCFCVKLNSLHLYYLQKKTDSLRRSCSQTPQLWDICRFCTKHTTGGCM